MEYYYYLKKRRGRKIIRRKGLEKKETREWNFEGVEDRLVAPFERCRLLAPRVKGGNGTSKC